ncbi:CBO0543 family protein [Bacillus piscicola]|uniref:CBO0543 family protein n=1 Tax=Bacillus piscicola TaxID=1632684 RepID=UPI001F08C7F2|nr:CBO0543 family protein [Bacillus piscicola]
MNSQQSELLDVIRAGAEKVSHYQLEYWQSFSNLTTWQYWLLVLMLVTPLIVLFIWIDKRKILLLGFFGLNYHVWFAYANKIGIGLGLWEYPYHLIPCLPSFSLDASLVPVCFMLLYQWTLHRKKNMYVYAVLLSAILAFIMKPLLVQLHLFHMFKGLNYVHLFLFYLAFFLVSKLITSLFVWLHEKEKQVSR